VLDSVGSKPDDEIMTQEKFGKAIPAHCVEYGVLKVEKEQAVIYHGIALFLCMACTPSFSFMLI
jgi:hypothetical protein